MKQWLAVWLIAAFFALTGTAFAKQTRDAQVDVWPEPRYPALAEWFGWEGYCLVRFAVDEEGHPYAVSPECTHRIFCFDAKRAVTGARFLPKLIGGVPTIRTNVVFPLEYAFEGSSYDASNDPRSLEMCEEIAVA